jgi:cation-transporting ATPase I
MLVGSSLLGFGVPLNSQQILMVNLITDLLPSLAVILQRPAHRRLDRLAREGLTALDSSLRKDTLVRGLSTALPSLAAYLMTYAQAGPQQAGSVAFASVITTQLAQTLDVGRVEGFLSRSVVGAVGGSLGLLTTFFALPPLRNLFGLTVPGLPAWGLVAGASGAAVVLSRALYGIASLRQQDEVPQGDDAPAGLLEHRPAGDLPLLEPR